MENICNVNTNQKRDVVAILKSKKHTIEQGKLLNIIGDLHNSITSKIL